MGACCVNTIQLRRTAAVAALTFSLTAAGAAWAQMPPQMPYDAERGVFTFARRDRAQPAGGGGHHHPGRGGRTLARG